MFLARNEGWISKDRVNLIETASATASLAAVRERRADGAALTLDEVISARAEGIPLTVVLVFDASAGADAVLARPDIETLPELAGKRIAVEQTALGAFMLQMVLDKAGVKKQGLSIITLSPDTHLAAWQKREIDAAITYEPFASLLHKNGMKKIFDSRQTPGMILDVLALRTELVASRSSAGRNLLQGHFRALKHFNENPNDAIYRMAGRFKLLPHEVLGAFRGLELPDLNANRQYLSGQTPKILASAASISRVMTSTGLIPGNDKLTDLVYPGLLPSGDP
jgi:NitT/TauT family transport system substrate-binding protein